MSKCICYKFVLFDHVPKLFNKKKKNESQARNIKKKEEPYIWAGQNKFKKKILTLDAIFIEWTSICLSWAEMFWAFSKVFKHFMQNICQHIRNKILKRFNSCSYHLKSPFSTILICELATKFPLNFHLQLESWRVDTSASIVNKLRVSLVSQIFPQLCYVVTREWWK